MRRRRLATRPLISSLSFHVYTCLSQAEMEQMTDEITQLRAELASLQPTRARPSSTTHADDLPADPPDLHWYKVKELVEAGEALVASEARLAIMEQKLALKEREFRHQEGHHQEAVDRLKAEARRLEQARSL